MAYSSWSVVFGEQPSAAKWNILGTNDASFNDGTGIAGLYKNLLTVDSNPYKFRVSRNAATNTGASAFAVIAFDTEQYDTNNNVSSGVYTVPVNGFYDFKWAGSITTSGAQTCILSLHKGGVETSRGNQGIITTSILSSLGHDQLQLTAGDTIDIRAYSETARPVNVGNTYTTFFTGRLVCRT